MDMTNLSRIFLVLMFLAILVASPLLANLPQNNEIAENPNPTNFNLNLSGNPFSDMSDREYRHLTEQDM